ncbi:MAG: hypothetical protein ABID09_00600 [Candidatus Omnitrophota bacterium]
MKKLFPLILAALFIATLVQAGGDRERTPKVPLLEPLNDAVVDLSGKESLLFRWKPSPRPGGGRIAYKFDLYKEFGYEAVFGEELEHDVYSIEVPVDKFENGALYSWQVKQRDARTRFWSMDHRWSFKVKK